MAQSSLYAGERSGARVFRIGRLGFDQGTQDLDGAVYTGTFRTERIFPAGPGGLVNFRRVVIHLLSSGTYEFTVRVWVDDARTTLAGGAEQEITITGGSGSLGESTEEIEIEADGSHIQVELTINSDDITGIFLVEGIAARGRIVRQGSTRAGQAS